MELRNNLPNKTQQSGTSIVLHNIYQRNLLCYGPQYGLEIYSQQEIGTKVVLLLPL